MDTFHKILTLSKTLDENERITQIGEFSDNMIVCLVELIFNILNGSVKVPRVFVQKLKPESENLRHLATLRNIEETRQFLVQTGGSPVAILLPVLISAASTILENVLR